MLLASYYYHYHLLLLLLLLVAMDMECGEEEACKTTAGDSEEKMITLELEAAEALAGLAYSATPHQQPESPPVINYGSSSFPPQKPSQPPSTCDLPPHLPQVLFLYLVWFIWMLLCLGWMLLFTTTSLLRLLPVCNARRLTVA